ncbi:MAG: transglycosylase domain-containing protein [Bacteroidota bacterium]|nr:transglycosylase domain-containing protein [Bacteroidota bacterium]
MENYSFKAVRLECSYSKKQIMALYASEAPFGSNVVGLDAASWRYFGRSPEKLSRCQFATSSQAPLFRIGLRELKMFHQ